MGSGHLLTSDFHYDLPPQLIAQAPSARRDESRLMVVDRVVGTISHTTFDRLPGFLASGDFMVFNRSRVIRARLHVHRPGGGTGEVLLLREKSPQTWSALVRPSRKIAIGTRLELVGSDAHVVVGERLPDGQRLVSFDHDSNVADILRSSGELPLPPYIHERTSADDRYQTVYADRDGSVAAPTAGLHFTPELMDRLVTSGLNLGFLTLHVGAGTFRPVAVEDVREHVMHAEWGEVPIEVACGANAARGHGSRIVAVGTTSARLLESASDAAGVHSWSGDTDLFIVPGYRFKAVDALVTNFHLPRSTLLMLVAAFAGRDLMLHAYNEAVRLEYRFFSFGDAMLIV